MAKKYTIQEAVKFAKSSPEFKPVCESGRIEPEIHIAREVMEQIMRMPFHCYRFSSIKQTEEHKS